MLPSMVRRGEQAFKSFDFENNPFKAQKQWPPDFSKLSAKHQFRLERRYRRRAKLAWARPKWVKATKLTQYGVTLFVVAYGVFYYDWGKEGAQEAPFQGARTWYKNIADSIWTHSSSQSGRDQIRKAEEARPPPRT